MSRGKQDDYDCIQRNFIFLKKELEARDLVDFLFQYGVISLDEKEHIENKDKKENRNDILLKLILSAGPHDAFDIFLQSLEARYRHVKMQLMQTDCFEKESKNSKDYIAQVSVQVQGYDDKIKLLEIENGQSLSRLQDCQEKIKQLEQEKDQITALWKTSIEDLHKLEMEKCQLTSRLKASQDEL